MVVYIIVGGDDVVSVVAVLLDALLHSARLRRAPVVVRTRMQTLIRNFELSE